MAIQRHYYLLTFVNYLKQIFMSLLTTKWTFLFLMSGTGAASDGKKDIILSFMLKQTINTFRVLWNWNQTSDKDYLEERKTSQEWNSMFYLRHFIDRSQPECNAVNLWGWNLHFGNKTIKHITYKFKRNKANKRAGIGIDLETNRHTRRKIWEDGSTKW